MTKTPTEDSTLIELLECIDDALRNGRLMTRANLAFRYLLDRLDVKHEDLTTYVSDLAQIAVEDQEDFHFQEIVDRLPLDNLRALLNAPGRRPTDSQRQIMETRIALLEAVE